MDIDMRKINAQWVFLIILALWIPVLCFANESEAQSIAEETEIVDAVDYEFVCPPAPENVGHGLMFNIWAGGVLLVWVFGGLFSSAITIVAIWHSLRFNYQLYITHGQFAFWTVSESTKDWDRRYEIAKELKYLSKNSSDDVDMTFLAWWPAIIVLLICWAAVAIGGFLWPAVFIAGFPFFVIRTIARKKRKKVVFIDKLKDKETNGLV